MATTECSGCGNEVNTQAIRCSTCGEPVWRRSSSTIQGDSSAAQDSPIRSYLELAADQGPTPVAADVPEDADLDDDEAPTLKNMRSDLRSWGIGLIVVGIAQLFIPLLDPLWAFVVIPIGVISLFVAHRVMFLAIGAALVTVGVLNIFGAGFGIWTFIGAAQIFWGVQEYRKFGKYADAA